MNYIWYRPGLGGNFLQRLFALSDHTQFLWIQGTCGCRPLEFTFAERWRWYYYRQENIKNWMHEAHLMPMHLQLIQGIDGHYWQTEPIMITAGHSWLSVDQFDINSPPDPTWRMLIDKIDQRYFYAKAGPTTSELLHRYLRLDKMSDTVLEQELAAGQWLHASVDPHTIHMDAILGTQEEFTAEYTRVCNLMGIMPIALDRAWEFQQNWRRLRIDNPPPGVAPEDSIDSRDRPNHRTWADIKKSKHDQ